MDNKIQYYRKQMNISQEELGEKLFVSRQTVSQWETGQTMPSLDNLMRLRELFGVSLDELLNSDETAPIGSNSEEPTTATNTECAEPDTSKEVYTLRLSREEVERTVKYRKKKLKRNFSVCIIMTALALLFLIVALSAESVVLSVFFSILLGMYISTIIAHNKNFKAYNKIFARDLTKLPLRDYTYTIDGEMISSVSVDELGITRRHTYHVRDITSVKDMDGIVTIEFLEALYILMRRSDLKPDSHLAELIKHHIILNSN